MNYSSLLILGLLPFSALAVEPNSRSMEALLVKSINSVGSNRLDAALNEVDALLKINPNFKLAQMLKGDLLMARAKPLSGFGNATDAPSDLMNGLRDEARARLQRVQQQPVTTAPRFIWQLNPQQRHAIVVDTSKSTLYLYENVNGTPRYVENFYISVGKKGSDKVVEGDQKTPLGGDGLLLHPLQACPSLVAQTIHEVTGCIRGIAEAAERLGTCHQQIALQHLRQFEIGIDFE